MKGRKVIASELKDLENSFNLLTNELHKSSLANVRLQNELMKFNTFTWWDHIKIAFKKLFNK